MLLGKRGVLSDRIETDPKNLDVACAKLVDLVAEPATFRRSTGSVGLGIKPQDDLFAAETGEREVFAFVRLYGEIGGRGADREHVWFPSCLKE